MTSAVTSGPMPVLAPSATAVAASAPLRLRCALVWRGEVMADHVARAMSSVTLGSSARSTFVVPDLELPADFAIVRPGPRGYLLTLGARMRGTICVDGHERDVADFVRRGGEGGDAAGTGSAFRSTAIGGRDWGVIDLDPDGHYRLFFQFVADDGPLPRRKRVLGLLLPAIAFSLLLHSVMLAVTYSFEQDDDPLAYPGPDALTGQFLIRRMQEEPEPPKTPLASTGAADLGPQVKVNSATKGREGKSGGKGEGPRARDPNPVDQLPPAPKVAFLNEKNKAVLDQVAGIGVDLGRYTRLPGPRQAGNPGEGKGTGTGYGDDQNGTGNTRGSSGDGPGAGGSALRDQISKGKIDTGETRAASGTGGKGTGLKEAGVVATGAASGDFGGLTKEEIDKVVRSRQGLVKSCYQQQLDRSPGIGGKLVVSFSIAATGEVTRSKIDGGKSSLRNAAVEECVLRQINKLRFPAKGGGFVNYPFIFSQGG